MNAPRRAIAFANFNLCRELQNACDGRRSVPPTERPSTGVGTEMVQSDPAGASHPRPRGRSAGSLTPHISVSVMCWGACLMAAESAL